MRKRTQQLDLFQERTAHLERLSCQAREVVVELTADLIAVVWQATRAARQPAVQREPVPPQRSSAPMPSPRAVAGMANRDIMSGDNPKSVT